MVRKNIIANYFGQVWAALMGFAFVPVYISYLGIEAFGLIGLLISLQAFFAILDAGLTPTLAREMSRYDRSATGLPDLLNLLRSVEVILLVLGILIFLTFFLVQDWVASNWIKNEALSTDQVAQAIFLMGMLIAVRLFETVYRSSMIGLEHQVLLNVVNCSVATVKAVGALVLLEFYSATLSVFFSWQAFISCVSLILLLFITYSKLTARLVDGIFSLKALSHVKNFAGGMFIVSVLAVTLTHIDKIILSKLLSLENFGFYALAGTVASVLYMVVTPITQAVYPRLCAFYKSGENTQLARTFHSAAQLVSILPGSAAVIVIFFSEELLIIWSQDSALSKEVGPILSLLMLGTLLNTLMWVPYQLQLSAGITHLAVYTNVVAVSFILPLLFWLANSYGAIGAAFAWIILNIGYIFAGTILTFRYVLPNERLSWIFVDVISPIAVVALVASTFATIAPSNMTNLYSFMYISAVGLISLFAAAFVVCCLGASSVRPERLRIYAKQFF